MKDIVRADELATCVMEEAVAFGDGFPLGRLVEPQVLTWKYNGCEREPRESSGTFFFGGEEQRSGRPSGAKVRAKDERQRCIGQLERRSSFWLITTVKGSLVRLAAEGGREGERRGSGSACVKLRWKTGCQK